MHPKGAGTVPDGDRLAEVDTVRCRCERGRRPRQEVSEAASEMAGVSASVRVSGNAPKEGTCENFAKSSSSCARK